MSGTVLDWLASRTPPPPAPLLSSLRGEVEGAAGAAELVVVLAHCGRRALERALAGPARERGTALALLAADALITYACEAAVEAEDVEGALAGILRGVVELGR